MKYLAPFAFVAMLAGASNAFAEVTIDLSYVDTNSSEYSRFKNFVDYAVLHPDNPGYLFAAADAAYMFKLTNQAQYCSLAVQLVDAQVTTAEQAISGGGAPPVAGDSYLQSGPMISDLAITYDWCAAQTTSSQRTRWSAYAQQTVWNIWNYQSATWGGRPYPWTGWSTDNPGDNYYYSFLAATMYWALADDASICSGNTTCRDFLAAQSIPDLETYFSNLPDGGSREGTGYGVSHKNLFLLYRMWRDSTQQNIADENSHLTDSILYWTHATVPTLDQFAPFGDQSRSSQPILYDYHRHLMLEAHRMTDDPSAASVATWWLDHISVPQMTSSFNYRYDLLPAGAAGAPPADLYYHALGTGHLFARTGWDTGAMWLAFAAGPYVESHAHQDQGSFTLYQNTWLAVTENIWSHSGIQQGTEVANVVRFNKADGSIIPQRTNTTSTLAITSTGSGGAVEATADLTPAYGSGSNVSSWTRDINFANRSLTVHDHYSVSNGATGTFQINVPTQPTVSGNTITAGGLTVQVLTPSNPTITLVNWSQANSDYNSGWRIDIGGGAGEYLVQLSAAAPPEEVFANGFD
ncbi:MAG: heparinase II/III family protein [Dokdonella sp.]